MAQIFLSYASEDVERARALVSALGNAGWSVWWDDGIAPGRRFDSVISEELAKAKCVVVLWSARSVTKNWVLEEAMEGDSRGILVPALIDDVAPPFGFRRLQAARLVDWGPGQPHSEFQMLIDAIGKHAPPAMPASRSRRIFTTSIRRESNWSRLLHEIGEGTLVPVLGPELLVNFDGSRSLMEGPARRLLDNYDVYDVDETSVPRHRWLDYAVGRVRGLVDRADLYVDVNDALSRLLMPGDPIPTPLLHLAAISDFRLMITLTPDDLMARALRGQGRGVDEIVHSPRLPAADIRDLPPDWRRPGGSVQLLYLFGKAQPMPTFAIDGDDRTEYSHSVVSRASSVPVRFLEVLHHQSLLLLGGDLTEPENRLLLRSLCSAEMVEERQVFGESRGVDAFVEELYRRWQEKYPLAPPVRPPS